jgi:hypothetical protein
LIYDVLARPMVPLQAYSPRDFGTSPGASQCTLSNFLCL